MATLYCRPLYEIHITFCYTIAALYGAVVRTTSWSDILLLCFWRICRNFRWQENVSELSLLISTIVMALFVDGIPQPVELHRLEESFLISSVLLYGFALKLCIARTRTAILLFKYLTPMDTTSTEVCEIWVMVVGVDTHVSWPYDHSYRFLLRNLEGYIGNDKKKLVETHCKKRIAI